MKSIWPEGVRTYYLPEANGRGKIVDVLTPEGQIDFTITRIRPVNICFIIPLLPLDYKPTVCLRSRRLEVNLFVRYVTIARESKF